jgi:fermentation-respiration switch protein FrsA (DUF1100 family)
LPRAESARGCEGDGPVTRPRRGAVLVLALVGLLGCMRVPLDRLIFLPHPLVGEPPAGFSDEWITTEDGVRLHAWRAPAQDGHATLVWSHGNANNIAGRAAPMAELAARGLGVLAYDYRGYGRSRGRPSEAGVYRDALAAYDVERAHGTPAEKIVCFGESLGGAVSMYLATARRCAGVAVVATFTDLGAVARVHYGALATAVLGTRFDSLSRVRALRVPILVAHGDRDVIVPSALGEELFAAAPEPKRFVRVAGAGHNDVLEAPELLDAVARFAEECCN